LEPCSEINYGSVRYTGIGDQPGVVKYIRPWMGDDLYHSALQSTDTSIVTVELYNEALAIWKVTFISRGSCWLSGTNGEDTFYINVNPTGSGNAPGELMTFNIVTLPHSDYQLEKTWFSGFGLKEGDSLIYQINDENGTPVTSGLKYNTDGLTVEAVTAAGIPGVYKITGLKAGKYIGGLSANGAYGDVFVNAVKPAAALEFVPAKEATYTAAGNIAYWTDGTDYYLLPDYPYAADEVMTRAKTAQLLFIACGWTASGPEAPFTDVTADMPEYDAIRTAFDKGIIQGYGDGLYGPNERVTRAQMATILTRALGLTASAGDDQPADVPNGAWFTEAVTAALANGLMHTYDNGLFGPNDVVSFGDVDVSVLGVLTGNKKVTLAEVTIPKLQQQSSGGGGGFAPAPSTPTSEDTKETVVEEDGTVKETVTKADGSKVETVTETDGKVTETVTAADGKVTETVTETDGSTKETVTNTDGSTEITNTAADGSTAAVKADAEGKITEAAAEVSAQAIEEAEDEPITLGLELTAEKDSQEAAPLAITIPEEAGIVKVMIPVKDVSSNSVVVLVHEDGTEEILPKASLTEDGLVIEAAGSVTVKILDNEKEFDDVPEDYWGGDAINFVTSRELFLGTDEKTFSPDLTMTRAMAVTVLFRLESKPDTEGAADFADVPEGQWYSDAIAWASENEIVQGYGDSFGKDDPITTEQLILMLYRMAGKPEAPAVETGASTWAADAMSWAVSIGLISGDAVEAQKPASRVETADLLMKFVNR
jgi:hypothetical protein